jgi:hypothetical protein
VRFAAVWEEVPQGKNASRNRLAAFAPQDVEVLRTAERGTCFIVTSTRTHSIAISTVWTMLRDMGPLDHPSNIRFRTLGLRAGRPDEQHSVAR